MNFTARIARFLLVALAAGGMPTVLLAQEAGHQQWDARFQSTWIRQSRPALAAPYLGPNSLVRGAEGAYTFSATAYLGWQPVPGLEFWFNPEVVQGKSLSGLHGFGGFPNGEQQKVSGPDPTVYRSRLFVRKTWQLGGEAEVLEGEANRFATRASSRRFVLTAGNLAVTDVFDPSDYARDPRTQFMNWSFMTHGAFDYAADARGYTWGAAGELYHDQWALRFGRFLQPVESNGLYLDSRIMRYYGDQLEIERGHQLGGQPGRSRLLLFRNRTRSGNFDDALRAAPAGSAPDLSRVRRDQTKIGAGFAVDQALSPDVGVFGRISWNDGRTETYAFTEIDRALSTGISAKGSSWGRGGDTVGAALAIHGLSSGHRRYLAAGGLGAFLGDGALNYARERVLELYYSLQIAQRAWLTLDWQRYDNPGYNRDRRSLPVTSVRFHVEL